MPFVRKRSGGILEVDDATAAELTANGKTVYATAREAIPQPDGGWQRIAPGKPEAPQGRPVMEVLFPRVTATQARQSKTDRPATPEGMDAVSGAGYAPSTEPTGLARFAGRQWDAAKDMVTLPFRAAAGAGSYLGTLGSEVMDGGLASPYAFAQAKREAQSQAARDMQTGGTDINYPTWARGFVAPAQDPVAAALSLLPLGKPLNAVAGRLGALASGGSTLAPAASFGAEALRSPIGQGLSIGATGAGIGLTSNAIDRAVTPGQSALDVSQDEINNAILQTGLAGLTGGVMGGMTKVAADGKSWLGGTVPKWLEQKAGRLVRSSIKPNGLDAQLAVEKALVEDRLLPSLVDNTTFTPGQIAANYYAKKKPISEKIGAALADADRAGPIYSSAEAIQASRTALADALRRGTARATPAQEAGILRNIEEATQNHKPRALGPWLPGQIEEAPMLASEAYNTKKINQNWAYDRLNTDPMMPQKAKAEAALGLSRNINQQLEESAPVVKMLDREIAPYSSINEAMETAMGPRSNRFIGGPAFWLSAAGTSGARQAWNIAQRLRAVNGMQSALPATLATYLTNARQAPLTSPSPTPTEQAIQQ